MVAPDPDKCRRSLRKLRRSANAVSFGLAFILLTFVLPLELVDAQSDPQIPPPSAPSATSPNTAATNTSQGADPAASQAADKNAPEMAASEVPTTFEVNVKLVVVRGRDLCRSL
jgi:hypothetical protein